VLDLHLRNRTREEQCGHSEQYYPSWQNMI
jgi:hypothetical protein